jgi:hypothetical protein
MRLSGGLLVKKTLKASLMIALLISEVYGASLVRNRESFQINEVHVFK